jgi:hypothetical protein
MEPAGQHGTVLLGGAASADEIVGAAADTAGGGSVGLDGARKLKGKDPRSMPCALRFARRHRCWPGVAIA